MYLPDAVVDVYITPPELDGWYQERFSCVRRGGVEVDIYVANGTNYPQVRETRPPPGSPALWEAIADSPAWHM